MKQRILILNGPNLNLTGRRQPHIYGQRSMEQIVLNLQQDYPDVEFTYIQSNHEGVLIDRLQEAGMPRSEEEHTLPYDTVILNAGGYSHTSVALRDTVEWLTEQEVPVMEVHLSQIYQREAFRRHSLVGEVCQATFMGLDAYEKAVAHSLMPGK